MKHDEAVDDLLQRTCLAFNARAIHAGAAAGGYAAAYVNRLADDVLKILDACEAGEREYLMEAYRSLSLAADGPAGTACRQREMLLDVARQGLAYASLQRGREEPASQTEVRELLHSHWRASLLAWAELFPADLDGISPMCPCGALGSGTQCVRLKAPHAAVPSEPPSTLAP
ncbi:hypothetical protein [Streptomyces niveus]|uniref:hypothetical protein n=1 Tax=Streptomyces niveus TaxID=193462 RepID=UPI00342F5845